MVSCTIGNIDSFHITWWPWKPVQLDGHLDWLHFDTYWSLNNCTCSCIQHWPDSFRSRGIKMESIKVAIQLHWFLWPPRYVKRVYTCWSAARSADVVRSGCRAPARLWSAGATASHRSGIMIALCAKKKNFNYFTLFSRWKWFILIGGV